MNNVVGFKKSIEITFIFFLFPAAALVGHDGHSEGSEGFVRWFGGLHLIFLHFPIALIVMTVVAELLFYLSKSATFAHAARFMIIFAAFTAFPTALSGFALAYDVPYEGFLEYYFWWHRTLGISTAILAIITACLRELQIEKPYYFFLVLSFISVDLTGYFGNILNLG